MKFSPARDPHDGIIIIDTGVINKQPDNNQLVALVEYLGQAKTGATGFTFTLENNNDRTAINALDNFIHKYETHFDMQNLTALQLLKSQLDIEYTLAQALKRANNIVLKIGFSEIESVQNTSIPLLSLPEAGKNRILNYVTFAYTHSMISPVYAKRFYYPSDTLAQAVKTLGLAPTNNSPPDRMLMPALWVNHGNERLLGFEWALIRQYLNITKPLQDEHAIRIGEHNIAHAPGFRVLPHYYTDSNGNHPFKIISAEDILTRKTPRETLNHKIVLIGPALTEVTNSIQIPAGNWISPTVVHAHIISSLLKNDIYHFSAISHWSRHLGLLLVGLYLVFLLPRVKTGSGAALTLLLFILGCNLQWLFMAVQHTWIPCILPLLALLCGYILQTAVHSVYSRFDHYQNQLSILNLQLAQNLQNQGHLDKAFEHYQKCLIDNDLLPSLYNLGLDYERKRQFNKAIKVFNYIEQYQKHYKDIQDHIRQNKNHANVMALSGQHRNTPSGTLILSGNEIEKPMLGRYQIEKVIGSGAMGTVYLGKDPKISRTVAIKTLMLGSEDEHHLQEYRKRFFREAQTAGRLNHPNIVTVYDVGEEHDLAYIAMDYLPGEPLSEYTKQKSLLPVAEIASIAIQITDALHYAHHNKVIHRDIKPANIIYNRKKKHAVITDFGVAHLADMNSTRTGTILGTPYYMSPEQLAGHKVDGRSDIFSLGIMLYQLVSGDLPFTGDNLNNLMYNITHKKHADIRIRKPELPICIRTIINRCLQKKADKRYHNCELLGKALANCRKQL